MLIIHLLLQNSKDRSFTLRESAHRVDYILAGFEIGFDSNRRCTIGVRATNSESIEIVKIQSQNLVWNVLWAPILPSVTQYS